MSSLKTPTDRENDSATSAGNEEVPAADGVPLQSADEPVEMASEKPPEIVVAKKRRASLEVGSRVMCRWRDGKFHPVKVVERRKVNSRGSNDFEYYVHYTECKTFNS